MSIGNILISSTEQQEMWRALHVILDDWTTRKCCGSSTLLSHGTSHGIYVKGA